MIKIDSEHGQAIAVDIANLKIAISCLQFYNLVASVDCFTVNEPKVVRQSRLNGFKIPSDTATTRPT